VKFQVSPSNLKGQAHIPGSKSNTTRAVIIATLAEGTSTIMNPVASTDSLTTVQVCKQIGAEVQLGEVWRVTGHGKRPEVPDDVLHMGNSGTTYYIMTGTACLINGYSLITGDYQIRRRPTQPLIDALNDLGAQVFSTRNTGMAPLVAKGMIKGGKAKLPGTISQWLSSLLLNCPLGEGDTELEVDNLQERPYIELTLGWLSRQGIEFKNDGFKRFKLRGGQSFKPFDETLPSDWESACFPLVAAAITDSDITLFGMDTQDVQGDKVIVDILKEMGADIEVKDQGKGGIRVRGGRRLQGIEIDCANIPDAPPILSVLGCCAEGKTVLRNLGASRLKETDRVKSIYQELTKMGAKMEERGDRLTIYTSDLHGSLIDGHHDHRIVMATAVAGLIAQASTTVDHAEYAKISFPTFYEVMKGLGADIKLVEGVE
jgi:3-phosphoshikimate 1-carboxyvinyltransferase